MPFQALPRKADIGELPPGAYGADESGARVAARRWEQVAEALADAHVQRL